MGLELMFVGVIVLFAFAIADLMVGVSNDAVNFLNSSLGSRVAPRHVIMSIASVGILVGVVFSGGMMEVARKGIFHPQLFTMPELLTIFLAVMMTDILLLDLFNTFGLPTSTTVSIVFELLGAAVVVSLLKIASSADVTQDLAAYINSTKAMTIIGGILLSVVVAFICGAIVQFLSRLLFTFDYRSRLKRYGSLWGGVAMASITYFILVKGAKGATFLDAGDVAWIKANTVPVLFGIFAVSAVVLQILQLMGVHILKPIVLVGTFALALAFAANDLVNFIGVPLAGMHAYQAAAATSDPMNVTMDALGGKVRTETVLLLVAGGIMVVTLWLSRKARTVTETEIGLGQQEGGDQERFGSSVLSRAIVRMTLGLGNAVRAVVPSGAQRFMARRMDAAAYEANTDASNRPSFDLLRASVNLMVASAVVSFATSQKLPLSTTYVTFMVAMGTSFADGAWGRESAVYRVTGVLTVVGGWFVTAGMAFLGAGLYALILFFGGAWGAVALLAFTGFVLYQTHHKHRARVEEKATDKVFNLEHVRDASLAVATTFKHSGHYVREIRMSLDSALNGLFANNELALGRARKRIKKIQRWANVIIANVFKSMRHQQRIGAPASLDYPQTVRRLQKLADGHRDVVMRSFDHVANHHRGLIEEQIDELRQILELMNAVFLDVESTLDTGHPSGEAVRANYQKLKTLAATCYERQSARIRDGVSNTRLSILFYAIIGNAVMLSRQTVRLLDIYDGSFHDVSLDGENDVD